MVRFAVSLLLLLPFVGSIFFLTRKLTRIAPERAVAMLGGAFIVVFSISVSIPFYLQGFEEELQKCGWIPARLQCPAPPDAPVHGWANLPLISVFAYMFSAPLGQSMLTMSILALVIGRITLNRRIDLAVRTVLIVFACFSLVEFYKYAVINWALE
jgi:hypothetical protein